LKSCLIVDDSPVIRKVAKRILQDLQYIITEAEYGAEALSKCRANVPDVILLDHVLPDMTAVEFIQSIMQLSPNKKPVILLCITQLDVVRIMKAKRAGATGYVLKPFTRATLLNSFSSQIKDLAA
jgi:two-component system, chemotaxis family, chemotaxis protein CheY